MRCVALLLAGANWRDRIVATLGALFGIGASAVLSSLLVPGSALTLVAPMGASAVLVFAVPSSPLAQPWPVIGGNVLSALVGIGIASLFGATALAAAVAVSLAILLMSALRCLHPPGGACALLGVLGGPAVLAKGSLFALIPVGVNAAVLVAAGLAFHRFSHHSYPHRVPAKAAAPQRSKLLAEDVDSALAESGESFDISREDLQALLDRAEHHAELRLRR